MFIIIITAAAGRGDSKSEAAQVTTDSYVEKSIPFKPCTITFLCQQVE